MQRRAAAGCHGPPAGCHNGPPARCHDRPLPDAKAIRASERRQWPYGTGDDAAAESPSSLPGPDELFALAEAGSQLHRALVKLSGDERWVLGLAYFRELSQSEIATATALPLGTVKSPGRRARQKLHDLVAQSSP